MVIDLVGGEEEGREQRGELESRLLCGSSSFEGSSFSPLPSLPSPSPPTATTPMSTFSISHIPILRPRVEELLSSSSTLFVVAKEVLSLVPSELAFSLVLETALPILMDLSRPVSKPLYHLPNPELVADSFLLVSLGLSSYGSALRRSESSRKLDHSRARPFPLLLPSSPLKGYSGKHNTL